MVAGEDQATLERVADAYAKVVPAGIHRAPSIEVAEAAKVLENTQRDINIALMNELALILDRLGLRSADVLAAAATKWNFMRFTPGLVGGHCIGVDPFYLTAKAEAVGYLPQVILSGRRINDGMGQWIAQETVRALTQRGCTKAVVTVLGMTFKENVPDIRNSKVIDIVRELERFGMHVQVADPLALAAETSHEYGVTLTPMDALQPADAVVFAVAHEDYVSAGWSLMQRLLKEGRGTVVDVKSRLDRATKPEGIDLWRL